MQRLEDLTEPELAYVCNMTAKSIETMFRILQIERPLFALLMFNDPRIAQWVSNCDRKDVIMAMRACADRLERQQDVTR